MSGPTSLDDRLASDNHAIGDLLHSLSEESGHVYGSISLNWIHWTILLGSLLVTFGAWSYSTNAITEKADTRFNGYHEQTVELLTERLSKYEDALWSGVALSRTSDRALTREEWTRYANSLDIGTRYPGVSGIGLIEPKRDVELQSWVESIRRELPDFNVHPKHDEAESLVISQIEPSKSNRAALGLDVAFEENRREGAIRSRESGKAVVTSPIVLVQDDKKTPGFLFFAPVYNESGLTTVEERKAAFRHWVYAPFIMSELIRGVLDEQSRQIGIRITDQGDELYSEWTGDHASLSNEQSVRRISVGVNGREWMVEAWPKASFAAQVSSNQPTLILISGLTIDAGFLCIFLLMTRSNRRIFELASTLASASQQLNTTSKELQQSNSELQSFAYIASHDLKSPLRGIRDLTEFVEEDLLELSDSSQLPDQVSHNFNRVRAQIDRMCQLIDGILSYSAAGKCPVPFEKAAMSELIDEIAEDLQLRPEQLILDDRLSQLETPKLPLKQVLQNLIGNAVKYGTPDETAVVSVTAVELNGFYQFSVADSGVGIDPRFHQRIFEVFQTLHGGNRKDSSGVGLAIVKKTVESYGGAIRVTSQPDVGTTFTFSWPREAANEPSNTLRKAA